jgi:hypothetical protein
MAHRRKSRTFLTALGCTVVLLAADPAEMPQPRYAEGNELIRPEGYRDWKFVGANIGMGYTEGQATPENAPFHNIYIQKEAFRQYVERGTFPDKTMLVMEVVSSGTNASINRRGRFQDRLVGVEVAVKDETRFPEKWAYFNLIAGRDKPPLARAKAFPKDSCWKCHNEHGAVDNVFVQFYPVLREARGR